MCANVDREQEEQMIVLMMPMVRRQHQHQQRVYKASTRYVKPQTRRCAECTPEVWLFEFVLLALVRE